MNTAAKIISGGHIAASVFTKPLSIATVRASYLEAQIKQLVAKYEGIRDPLCDYLQTWLGDSPVLIEFEYEAGENAVYDLNSPMCGPGVSESVGIGMALINGVWTSTEDFPQKWLDRWEQEAIDVKNDQMREDYEDRQSERAYD